jgi:hypothetical protein
MVLSREDVCLPGPQNREAPADEAETCARDASELTRILGTIPMMDPAYGAWWSTADGTWLYERIRVRVGVSISATVNRLYGAGHEPADVANTAVTMLRQDFTHAYIRKAQDPWSYLSKMLKREMFNAVGTHFRTELGDCVLPAVADPQEQGASLAEAAEATWGLLAPMVLPDLRGPLRAAIDYFSELGGARISHLYTYATSDTELTDLGLSRPQILAIANAVLGARPNNSQNSLISAFLLDPEFDPSSSLLHRKALKKFGSRMAAANNPEVLVAS